jgi:hypothetical protein
MKRIVTITTVHEMEGQQALKQYCSNVLQSWGGRGPGIVEKLMRGMESRVETVDPVTGAKVVTTHKMEVVS